MSSDPDGESESISIIDAIEEKHHSASTLSREGLVKGKYAKIFSGIGRFPIEPVSITLSCLLYTSPSPRDGLLSRMPSSA